MKAVGRLGMAVCGGVAFAAVLLAQAAWAEDAAVEATVSVDGTVSVAVETAHDLNPGCADCGSLTEGIAVGEPDPNGDGDTDPPPDIVIDDGAFIPGDGGVDDIIYEDGSDGSDDTGVDDGSADGSDDSGVDDGSDDGWDDTGIDDGTDTGTDTGIDDGTTDDGTTDEGSGEGSGDTATDDGAVVIYMLGDDGSCINCEMMTATSGGMTPETAGVTGHVAVDGLTGGRGAKAAVVARSAGASCSGASIAWLCDWQSAASR